jgi:dTDP-glucose 4,6-dehydratase
VSRAPQNLLVTGGAGFIGSSFIRAWLADASFSGTVVNLDALTYAGNLANLEPIQGDARYTFVRGDITDPGVVRGLFQDHDIDTVVHFAAESHVDRSIHGPQAFVQTNVIGTFTLLEAAREKGDVHFHHVSTDEVYGSLGETGAFSEATAFDPRSPYSASKAASDHLVSAYFHTYGLQTTLSNCSNNYGPYQFPEKLIPLMILKAVAKESLPVYGDGLYIRDWLYVDDHSEAVRRIIADGRAGETYCVGGLNEWTNLDLLNRLLEIVAEEAELDADELKGLITFVKDRPGHDRRYAIDTTKIHEELGWSPTHDFDAGLRETVRWYLDHEQWIEDVRSGAYREWIEENYGDR